MRRHRLPVNSTAIALAVAVVTSITLTAFVPAAGSTPEEADARSLNRFEHEARRSLSDTRDEQARTLKGGEHLARRPLAETPQARSYNQREHLAHRDVSTATRVRGVAVSANLSASCADGIAQAWRGLGHFSDGYERHLLRQPPCR